MNKQAVLGRRLWILLLCTVVLCTSMMPAYALEASSDSTLTEKTDIVWQSGTFTVNSGLFSLGSNDKSIRAVLSNPQKQSLYFELADGYEFKVIETVASGSGYTARRRYGEAFTVKFNTWMDFGYFHVYSDRIYLIEVRSKDGSTMSADTATDYIRVYTVDNANHVPKYYTEHIADKAASVNKIQAKNDNTFSFIFMTDMHIQHNAKHSIPLVKHLINNCDIKDVLGAGDWVTAWLSDADGKQGLIDDMVEQDNLWAGIPLIKSPGNHEFAFGGKNQYGLLESEMYEHWYRKDIEAFPELIVKNDNGDPTTYFYKDDPVNRIRYISLNVLDYEVVIDENGKILPSDETAPADSAGDIQNPKTYVYKFSQEQLDWFKDVALKMPDDEWVAVAFTHIALWNRDEKPGPLGDVVGMNEEAKAIVKGFINKNNGFEDYKGSFIGWMSGHHHQDFMVSMHDFVQTAFNGDAQVRTEGTPARDLNTVNEQSFDVLTVDKENRRVYLTKIGAGDDRSFKY